jgi:hypothetical protein
LFDAIHLSMDVANHLEFPTSAYAPGPSTQPGVPDSVDAAHSDGNDSALEDLLHQKSGLQAKKLEILAAELRWRLHLAAQNLYTLGRDRAVVIGMIDRLTVDANYRLRDHQEKAPLYRRLFDIETEERTQQVDCWRDVANVMRDFLGTWEAHEQARARAMFLENVGQGAAGDL